MPFQENEVIGPYRIVEQIGQGGMANVYRAYQTKLGRYVAIKVLHSAFLEDKNFLARFEREARIIASLDHPHIVPVYDYDEHGGQPYLVMKYVEGRTLKDLLLQGSVPLDEIVRIMTAVADALTYAHKQGVLHRDIKPSNIIIDENGTPYLTDFGLARIAQSGESTLSMDVTLGTPNYISPEQAKGEKNLDGRTDVYSLGIILYELVVGRVPYTGDTPYIIVHHHIYSPPPLPSDLNPDIPAEVESVLLKALAKDPAERYQTPRELMDAFRQAVGESGLVELKTDRVLSPETGEKPKVSVPAPIPREGSKSVVVERSVSTSEIDFGQIGRKIESGLKQGAGFINTIAEQIKEEVERGRQPQSEEERIRRRIEKRHKERVGLIIHFTIYLLINLVFWGMWAVVPDVIVLPPEAAQGLSEMGGLPWPIFISVFWGVGLLAHFLAYYYNYGAGANRREREIQREIERRRMAGELSYMEEKPKRKNEEDTVIRLTADGELTDSYVGEWEAEEKRRRR